MCRVPERCWTGKVEEDGARRAKNSRGAVQAPYDYSGLEWEQQAIIIWLVPVPGEPVCLISGVSQRSHCLSYHFLSSLAAAPGPDHADHLDRSLDAVLRAGTGERSQVSGPRPKVGAAIIMEVSELDTTLRPPMILLGGGR